MDSCGNDVDRFSRSKTMFHESMALKDESIFEILSEFLTHNIKKKKKTFQNK